MQAVGSYYGDVGPLGDPDGDGMATLDELFFGLNPAVADYFIGEKKTERDQQNERLANGGKRSGGSMAGAVLDRPCAYIQISIPEGLTASTKVYLRSVPKQSAVILGKSTTNNMNPMPTHEAEVGAFHLYVVNRAASTTEFTPVWGGRLEAEALARIPIYSQTEVGGWPALLNLTPLVDIDGDGIPDAWETANGLNPNDAKDANLDPDGNGYSHLEEYIHSLTTTP